MEAGRCALALGLVAVLSSAAAAGCGGNTVHPTSEEPEVEASCAFVVDYAGHRYVGRAAAREAVEGKPLGTATQPGCQDTPNEPPPVESELEVSEIVGVPPEVAIMMRGRGETILLREDVDPQRLPAAVERLLSGSS